MKKYLIIVFVVILATLVTATDLEDIIYHRIDKYHMRVSKRDLHLLKVVIPYIEQIALLYQVDPVMILAIMEQESNYRWVIGDNGDAIGFMQIHTKTAKFVANRFEELLDDLKLNKEFNNPKDLYLTPIRTTVLSTLFFIYNYQRYDDVFLAIKRFNGIGNDTYLYSVLKRYAEVNYPTL